MPRERQHEGEDGDPPHDLEEQYLSRPVTRHREASEQGGAGVGEHCEQSPRHSFDEAREGDCRRAGPVAAPPYGQRRAHHHDDREGETQRREPLAEEGLGQDCNQHRRDVEQRGRARDASSRDAELVRDLEQCDQRASAQAHEQPRPAVDAEQAGVQQAVHEKADQADQQAPEPDSRDRFAFAIQRCAEGPRGAPHGAGTEREQVAGEARRVGRGVSGSGCHGAVVAVLMARKDRNPATQKVGAAACPTGRNLRSRGAACCAPTAPPLRPYSAPIAPPTWATRGLASRARPGGRRDPGNTGSCRPAAR